MLLSTALRAWVTANRDALSLDDRRIATDLSAEIENSEFAQLTTDLSIEQQVTIVAVTSIGDRERVGHVFRSALHWHATGGSEAAAIAKPPVPGALPPTVSAPSSDQSPATQSRPTHAPGRRPPVPASPASPKRPLGLSEDLFWLSPLALVIAVALASFALTTLSGSQGDDEVGALPNVVPAPTPTPTTNPALRIGTGPTPTTAPTPTTNPALRIDTEPTPTTNPASQGSDYDEGLWGVPLPLYVLDPAPTWKPTWTLEVSPGRIIDPAERGEIPAGYQVIAFDATIQRFDGDDAAAQPPLAFPRLIFFGGASQLPNLGGGNFTCPTNDPWPQFVFEVDDVASGTMCFIETEADLASPISVLIFESDGHLAVVFPINEAN